MSEELEGTAAEAETSKGKTFSEEYVKSIREEARDSRIARQTAEKEIKAVKDKFKKLIGLKDDEEIDDSKLTAYQSAQEQKISSAMQKANDRLIQAEIKSLDGYDTKLVDRLLDKSKLSISDDGTVTGLKEAIDALAVEFPLIKAQPKSGGANPPPADIRTAKDEYEEALKLAYANPRDESLKRKVFLLKEKLKGE